ncbi:hypothetical protein M3Y99_01837700 [Aphelenchoides fujianensis]|nr:hypothetical protein M3Y99_01837700 [Aphelenchoides fujianensis]
MAFKTKQQKAAKARERAKRNRRAALASSTASTSTDQNEPSASGNQAMESKNESEERQTLVESTSSGNEETRVAELTAENARLSALLERSRSEFDGELGRMAALLLRKQKDLKAVKEARDRLQQDLKNTRRDLLDARESCCLLQNQLNVYVF